MENDDLLEKKYIILKKIGRGGSAKVFEVQKIGTDKIYAAKVLKEKDEVQKNEKTSSEIFDNEINILKYLKNKKNNLFLTNLIDIGIGEVKRKDHPTSFNKYLILEYAEKSSLFNYIYLTNIGLNEEYSKIIFYKILMGLQSIHKENICHRDIKLENILLDENYNPKLCDFGLSEFNKENLTESVGTVNYAAPEILEQKPYNGFKIDIFSLGVTLLTLVTGATGFSQATSKDFAYFLIKNNLYEQYWNAFGIKGIGLSE